MPCAEIIYEIRAMSVCTPITGCGQHRAVMPTAQRPNQLFPSRSRARRRDAIFSTVNSMLRGSELMLAGGAQVDDARDVGGLV